jgi:hypothetical protein
LEVIFLSYKEGIFTLKENKPDFQVDTKEESDLRRSLSICTTKLIHFFAKSKFNISSPFDKSQTLVPLFAI